MLLDSERDLYREVRRKPPSTVPMGNLGVTRASAERYFETLDPGMTWRGGHPTDAGPKVLSNVSGSDVCTVELDGPATNLVDIELLCALGSSGSAAQTATVLLVGAVDNYATYSAGNWLDVVLPASIHNGSLTSQDKTRDFGKVAVEMQTSPSIESVVVTISEA